MTTDITELIIAEAATMIREHLSHLELNDIGSIVAYLDGLRAVLIPPIHSTKPRIRGPYCAKPVRTPLGAFQSITEAAIAHGVCDATIPYRIEHGKPGYSFMTK